MRQRFALISIVMLLFIVVPLTAQGGGGFGAEIEITHLLTATPVANIVFTEPVTVNRAEFIKLDVFGIDIDYIVPSQIDQLSAQSYTSTPIQGLTNGYYYFEVEAADNVGNIRIFRKEFALVYPTLDIIIIDPPLGVTDSTPFDLTIKTFFKNATYPDAQCKYGTSDPNDDYDSAFLTLFPQSVGALHTIPGFSTIATLVPNVPSPPYYFICLDADLRPTTKRMYALIDTITPAISSLSFDPKTIIEFPLGGEQFQTDMVITATEPVLCKYSLNETLPFEEMTPVGKYKVDDYASFSESLRETIYLPIVDKVQYEVTVICRDRAGFLSPPKIDNIKVDLSASIGINVISPSPYDLGENITLLVSTAKMAYCEYSEDGGSEIILSTESNPLKLHEAPIGYRDEGTYSLGISCHSGAAGMFQDQTLTYEFTVDRTPPGVTTINGSTITCSNTALDVSPALVFSAEDLHSGISTFEYSIVEYGINKSGSSLSQVSLPGDVNLTPGMIVNVNVIAVDNVGLKGPSTTVGITYDPNHPDCLEKNKPSVNVGQEKFPGEVRVTLTCTDDTGCDDASFLYGLDLGANCTPYQNYLGSFSVYNSQTLCYYVKDVVGNEAEGSAKIVVEVGTNCANGIQDGDETGIDCGGSCGASCGIGGPCASDNDCLSGYCADGICAEPTCDDAVQNGKESGTDCGGASDCEKCGIGQSCYTNPDCLSIFCHPDSKTCQNSSCTDNFMGGSETDIDCGGMCSACGNGKKCSMDSDCLSGNCAMGYCSAKAEDYEEEPTAPTKEDKGPVFPIILFILGLLMISGGIGYLVYKHRVVRPKAAIAAGRSAVPGAPRLGVPGAPTMAGARPMPGQAPGMSAAMLKRMKEQKEKQKHLAELIKKKLDKTAENKRDKRSKVFDTFAPAKPKAEKIVKPSEEIAIKEKTPAGPKVDIDQDWVTVGDLNKAMKKQKVAAKAKTIPKKKKTIDVGEDVAMLDKVTKKEQDLFDKLPGKDMVEEAKLEEDPFAKLPGKEAPADADEDIFKRMEEKSRKEEMGDDPFARLGKKTSKKRTLKDMEE